MMRLQTSVIFLLITLLQSIPSIVSPQQLNRIRFHESDLFLSGGNVAWINFARDIGPGTTRLDLFEQLFRQVHDSGGNAMRLWLHTTGAGTPQWSGSDVTGPGEGAIEDLRAILDAAYFYDVGLILVLWSFDMLNVRDNPQYVTDRAYDLLTQQAKLDLYIRNALIPMVDSLKGHPAILSWEIFNEAEGMSNEFGWSHTRHVPMADIQRFVNQAAGAIRRTDPNVHVTTGVWSFYALTDGVLTKIAAAQERRRAEDLSLAELESLRRRLSEKYNRTFTAEEAKTYYNQLNAPLTSNIRNYYRDDRLITAGGDSAGTLDFYTVHYYDWAGTEQSPFHHLYSRWELSKPLVIGEFYVQDTFGVPARALYETLYTRGYAGALGWQWYDWYANRQGLTHNWPNALENMQSLRALFPNDVRSTLPGIRIRFSATPQNIELGWVSTITWSVRGAVTVTLNGIPVAFDDSLVVQPDSSTTYRLEAVDERGKTEVREITISVVSPIQINRALRRRAVASSSEPSTTTPGVQNPNLVTDGNMATRWSSAWQDNEWIYVDLEKSYNVKRVVLHWEVAYASEYTIDMSFDGVVWTTVHEERNGTGGTDEILFEDGRDARFVRMHGVKRATQWGFSLWELEVYGLLSEAQPPRVTIVSPIENAFLEVHVPVTIEAEVQAGSNPLQQVDFYIDSVLAGSASASPYRYIWSDPGEGLHTVFAVARDGWFEVHSPLRDLRISVATDSLRREAEASTRTGSTQVLGLPSASGGAFVRMTDAAGSSLTWQNIQIANAGSYGLRFRYRLSYDTPKGQFIDVNGSRIGEVMFTGAYGPSAPWLTLDLGVQLISGPNTISIVAHWGWMDFDYIEIRGQNLTTAVEEGGEVAHKFTLLQNYPNPFNSATVIPYSVAHTTRVSLKVFDLLGRHVATLADEVHTPGSYRATFNAEHLASGIYLYRLQGGGMVLVQRMVLIK